MAKGASSSPSMLISIGREVDLIPPRQYKSSNAHCNMALTECLGMTRGGLRVSLLGFRCSYPILCPRNKSTREPVRSQVPSRRSNPWQPTHS